jgi:hypothetical protein
MEARLQGMRALPVALGFVGKLVAPRAGGARRFDELAPAGLDQVALAARLLAVARFEVAPVE